MLTEQQAIEIKTQIINQIDSTFPEDKKETAKKQVKEMNIDELELFLKQNNLMVDKEESNEKTPSKCVFCSIFKGEIPSYKINNNKEALAVLEINPISKGHVLIIPKDHITDTSELNSLVFSLSKKISKIIKTKLKPKDIIIYSSKMFDHIILNILPIYNNETQNSSRRKTSEDDLKKLQSLIEIKPKKKIEKIKKNKIKPKQSKNKELPNKTEKIWLPRRIP